MLLAPLLLAAAQLAAPAFAPPEGVPFRVVTERSQDESGTRTGYRMERLVRFARDGIGWRAEVRIVAASSDAPPAMAAMFETGFSGLAGRTLVFRLNGAGKVVAIDDQAAVWDAFCRGIAALALAGQEHDAAALDKLSADLTAPLCALPVERQRALLASLVEPLAAEDAGGAGATRAVRVPAQSPYGGSAMLDGMRTVAAQGDLLRTTTRAEAEIPGADGPARVALLASEDRDPRTGMLATSTETVRTALGEGASARRTEKVTTVRVAPLDPALWPGQP